MIDILHPEFAALMRVLGEITSHKRKAENRPNYDVANLPDYATDIYHASDQIFDGAFSRRGVPEDVVDELVGSLIRLKDTTYGIRNVPVHTLIAYGHGRNVLSVVDPEAVKVVELWQPRRAFREIVHELLRHPLSLAGLPDDDYFDLEKAVLAAAKKEIADKSNLFLDEEQWRILKLAGTTIDAESITLHKRAAVWLGEYCYLPDRQETDRQLCERVIAEIRQVYAIRRPSTIILEQNGTDASYLSQNFNQDEERHYSTFVNFHRLSAKEKFLILMHEGAGHMYRNETIFNPDYKIPQFNHVRVQAGEAARSGITCVERTVATPSPEQVSNYSQAVAAFGDKAGYSIYRKDFREREASLVERLAKVGMMIGRHKKSPARGVNLVHRLWLQQLQAETLVRRELYPRPSRFNFADRIAQLVV